MPKNKAKKKRSEVYAKEEPSNRFKNDGSFMDMFKRMAEQTQQAQQQYQDYQQYCQQQQQQHQNLEEQEGQLHTAGASSASGIVSTCEGASVKDHDEPYMAPQSVTYKSGSTDRRSQQGLVGKRKDLLKSIELREKRKRKLEEKEEQQNADQESQKSSAWKSYMAEVKAYEAMKCGDSEEHKRPLVK